MLTLQYSLQFGLVWSESKSECIGKFVFKLFIGERDSALVLEMLCGERSRLTVA